MTWKSALRRITLLLQGAWMLAHMASVDAAIARWDGVLTCAIRLAEPQTVGSHAGSEVNIIFTTLLRPSLLKFISGEGIPSVVCWKADIKNHVPMQDARCTSVTFSTLKCMWDHNDNIGSLH